MSSTETEDPIRDAPHREREAPSRANALRDIEAPKWKKSNTAMDDPKLVNPMIDSDAPTSE
jgi:hypothetical protein